MRFKIFLLFITIVLGINGLIAYAGTLSCSITTDCSGGTVIFRMKNTTNSHAGMPVGSSYTNLVCCTGVTGLGNSCSGIFATALKLSGTTNAHVQQSGSYAQSACISVPSGGSVSVGYQATNCSGFDTTLASMKATTNSHVGNTTAYTEYKICGTAASAGAVVSVSVSDGIVTYGTMAAGASKTTINLTDTQTLTNDGNVTETFNIKGQNTACPWTLASSAGTDQYVHEFCKKTDVSCSSPPTNYTVLTTSYQTLYTGVSAAGARQLDLRITVPTTSSCFTQQAVDVTIQAVQ
jgi:hypothetical protein